MDEGLRAIDKCTKENLEKKGIRDGLMNFE